ncbi:MAG TPA: hypothetical protein VHZ74_15735 [Bryobacteraceae bacterium]|nr:hypothetical protein [Bryobacteraceae bacterium]
MLYIEVRWQNAILLALALCGFSAQPLVAGSYDCTALNVPGNPTGINNAGVIVGSGGGHGFIRDASGNVTTIDYPGTTSGTNLLAINNKGVITGQNGSTYFIVDLSGNFTTLTIPPPYSGYANLLIYGINDNNVMLGSAFNNALQQGTMFLLNPDGSVSPLGPPDQVAGSLSNSGQYLSVADLHSAFNLSTTYLVNPDGTSAKIFWNGPGKYFDNVAYGLNKAGTVVGYASENPSDYPFAIAPFEGFVRDPSGAFSALQCAGLSQALPNAINDNNVIVGSAGSQPFLATPVSGTPKLQVSVTSLSLPPMLTPQNPFTPTQSAPGTVVLTNVGDGRLDIGAPQFVGPLPPFAATNFSATPCMDHGNPVVSLSPGESCTVTVTVSLSAGGGIVNDTLYFDDSSAGSPHAIPVSIVQLSSPSPLCQDFGIVAGPPHQANFVLQDNGSGLAGITTLASVNATVNIAAFTAGTENAQLASAVQLDPTQPAQVSLQLTTQNGATATCGATFGVTQWSGLGGTFTGRVSMARNIDGRIQAFVRAPDTSLWFITQTNPGGPWSGWASLGGSLNSDPVVSTESDGRLDVFALGADNSLWHITQTSPGAGWSAWQGLGASLAGQPAVAVNSDGTLQVFARGTDNALWEIQQTSAGASTWQAWGSLGGVLVGNPAVVVNTSGRVEVFGVGGDNALWDLAETGKGGPWGTWTSLGSTLTSDPAAALNSDGRVDVFARGSDNGLWHTTQTTPGAATYSGWNSLGGVIISTPVVGVDADGRLEVFVLGSDAALWRIAETTPGANWSGWTTLAGGLADQPGPALNTDGRLEVLVRGSDNALYDIEQSSAGAWN